MILRNCFPREQCVAMANALVHDPAWDGLLWSTVADSSLLHHPLIFTLPFQRMHAARSLKCVIELLFLDYVSSPSSLALSTTSVCREAAPLSPPPYSFALSSTSVRRQAASIRVSLPLVLLLSLRLFVDTQCPFESPSLRSSLSSRESFSPRRSPCIAYIRDWINWSKNRWFQQSRRRIKGMLIQIEQ